MADRKAEDRWAVHDGGFDTYREASRHLRRPFTPAAVKFKLQATAGKWALIVPYIDARLVIERFNAVIPHLWSERFEERSAKALWCHITIEGQTHSDVGVAEPGEQFDKSLVSDALKRAATHFGVGVSLYSLDRMYLQIGTPDIRTRTKKGRSGEKEVHEISDKGDKKLRAEYAKWLKSHGEKLFGPPLDHGDITPFVPPEPVSQLEQELEESLEAEEQPLLTGKMADTVRAECSKAYMELVKIIGKQNYPPMTFKQELESVGHSLEEMRDFALRLDERLAEARKRK